MEEAISISLRNTFIILGMGCWYSYYYTYVEIQFKDMLSTSTFKSFVRYIQYGK